MRTASRKGIWIAIMALAIVALCAGMDVATAAVQQGQQGQQGQQPPKPSVQPGQTAQPAQPAQPAAPPVNKEEDDTVAAFFNGLKERVDRQIQLGEEFVQKYPESRYREGVYARLASLYQSAGQEQKMFAASDKVLELNPNHIDVLTLVSWALPRRTQATDLDAEQKLQKSEKCAQHVIELITGLTKPANLTEEDFLKAKNERLSMVHSGMGMVHYHHKKFADMAASLEQATQLAASPDPADFFLLATAYMHGKRYNDAATAFGRCSEVLWGWQERCKSSAEEARKQAATQLSAPPPPPPPLPPKEAPKRIRVGGQVQQARLISQPRPIYPALAKQARIQGTVQLQAVIAKDGSVLQLDILSGHPLLLQSAMDAVRQWRYHPVLLNGEPVEVVTTIAVIFTLSP